MSSSSLSLPFLQKNQREREKLINSISWRSLWRKKKIFHFFQIFEMKLIFLSYFISNEHFPFFKELETRKKKSLHLFHQFHFITTGGPRYSRTFYLRIRLFAFEKWPKVTLFQSKMDFLSANSRFAVQNDGTYLPRITRETCIWLSIPFLGPCHTQQFDMQYYNKDIFFVKILLFHFKIFSKHRHLYRKSSLKTYF